MPEIMGRIDRALLRRVFHPLSWSVEARTGVSPYRIAVGCARLAAVSSISTGCLGQWLGRFDRSVPQSSLLLAIFVLMIPACMGAVIHDMRERDRDRDARDSCTVSLDQRMDAPVRQSMLLMLAIFCAWLAACRMCSIPVDPVRFLTIYGLCLICVLILATYGFAAGGNRPPATRTGHGSVPSWIATGNARI